MHQDKSNAAETASFTWPKSPTLVATTRSTYSKPIVPTKYKVQSLIEGNNFFKSCQWSPDGTTLLTSSADDVLRTFILPSALLEGPEVHNVAPYHEDTLPASAYATAIHPAYNLSDPTTAIYLASIPDLPIRLLSPFSTSMLASYPLINPTTEAYMAPYSLLFDATTSHAGAHFLAGGDSQINIFDLNRPGGGPHVILKTIPSKRKKIIGGGVGMKGIVSAMSMSPEGLLAAGTFTRWVGLYDGGGRGGEVGVFQLGKVANSETSIGDGAGVTQMAWSGDGRYLITAERKSNGVSVWDIRGTGQRLAWLDGRGAVTMQRMSIDLVGDTLIAGGTDGCVRAWTKVGIKEGTLVSDWQFKAHDDVVSSAVCHPTAAILATCSGQRHQEQDNANSEADDDPDECRQRVVDNSLKVWSLYSELHHGFQS